MSNRAARVSIRKIGFEKNEAISSIAVEFPGMERLAFEAFAEAAPVGSEIEEHRAVLLTGLALGSIKGTMPIGSQKERGERDESEEKQSKFHDGRRLQRF